VGGKMKKLIFAFMFSTILFNILPQDKIQDVEQVVFTGINIDTSDYKNNKDENKTNYSIVYSPFLPSGGIYSLIDKNSGKEAIIQIGNAMVNQSPFNLYISNDLFNFFSSFYPDKKDKLNLYVKFLAWNKKDNESDFLNLSNLIVKLEDSYAEITKNGLDKYYIQLGSFSYYQNSYTLISDMMPYLKIVPQFYLVKKQITVNNNEKKDTYRLLVGPYSLDDAREITKKINDNKKTTVFIHSGEAILKEYNSSSKNGDK
jgi:hypothetical protein